ncbi:MAG TPA: DsbE family thiol:disulfide interchange protein [Bauldia sp.]|nr:DsbE family thiol:disulfide interchange protein [Bauldia sp.]
MSEPSVPEVVPPAPKPRLRLALLVPLAIFAALAVVFLVRLETGGDSSLPSALIGRTAPDFSLSPLPGTDLPGLTHASLLGQVSVVNIFASWCAPCRQEHPFLAELAKDSRIRVVGINYKDSNANALRFLNDLGNPYAAIGVDPNGRAAIDWGVYGVPETFIVGADGVILHKFVGPISEDALTRIIRPQIEAALKR